jgi:hypothetical protein
MPDLDEVYTTKNAQPHAAEEAVSIKHNSHEDR